MIIKIEFNEGIYSDNKADIKKVFSILDYKYSGARAISDELMYCFWKRKDNKSIKAIFHGSGKACEFIVDCKESEEKIFNAIAIKYQAKISDYVESKSSTEDLFTKAKAIVDKWFTPQKQLKDEPNIFYNHRVEKEKESYNRFIEAQLKILKGEI